MIRKIHLLAVLVVASLSTSCGYHAVTPQAEDAVVVKLVTVASPTYNHPLSLSAQDLAVVLQGVRVKFKANWLQTLIAGSPESLPLFDDAVLARVVPPLHQALEQASAQDRIVFYVAHRRSDVRRDVTSGTMFVKGRLLHLVLANYLNPVDVLPGILLYDQENPEVAVVPQHFSLEFAWPEVVVERKGDLMNGVFGAAPPGLMVDYDLFQKMRAQELIASRLP